MNMLTKIYRISIVIIIAKYINTYERGDDELIVIIFLLLVLNIKNSVYTYKAICDDPFFFEMQGKLV